jgi:uncharacterized protein (DUF362 family)
MKLYHLKQMTMSDKNMKKSNKREGHRKLALSILIAATVAAICWDFSQAAKLLVVTGAFRPESQFINVNGVSTKVSVVASNYETLPNPAPITEEHLAYQQVEDMVREALRLQGGLDLLIKPGDKVLIKPNIVDPEPAGSGEVTDVRVVKALVKIINEAVDGNVEIVIGEASPREMDYELSYSSSATPKWQTLWDAAGYQDLLTDAYLQGINFYLHNLNGSPPENPWQDLVLVDVPGGGVAAPHGGKYWIHKDILEADVLITCPVLKTHKAGLTCALKNQIGIAPSTKYGFPKTGGVPQDNYSVKLIHRADLPRDWTDEEIVDLCSIAGIDLVVVDAIATLEEGKEAIRDNEGNITNLVRFNTIVAGTDPVAVDHVCSEMIGLNPDDIAHITLAEKIGLGTNDANLITVYGSSVDQLKQPLKKDPYLTSDYGQSNRTWLISHSFSTAGITNPMSQQFITNEATTEPLAGLNGWSAATYFFDDRIDMGSFLGGPSNIVSYAFTYFDAPLTQNAELWLGSDESMRIYLNGQIVYDYSGSRSYSKDRLVSEKVPVQIQQGENTLLVKTLQKYGTYDFALNICQPESDPDLDGNRVAGLKFYTQSEQSGAIQLILPDTTTAPGQTVNLPVALQLQATTLSQCQFTVAFDPDVVQGLGVVTQGSLSETGTTVDTVLSTPGEMSVTLNSNPAIQSAGTLIYLRFAIVGAAGDTSDLVFTNSAANAGEVTVNAENGKVRVQNPVNPTINFKFVAENPGAMSPGATNKLLANVTAHTDIGSAAFTALRLKLIGTCALADVARMAVFRDNGDGIFSAADDSRIGYNRFQSQSTLVRFAVAEGVSAVSKRYFIVADIAEAVGDPSNTFGVEITNNTYMTVTAPAVVHAEGLPFQSLVLGLPVEIVSFQAEMGKDRVLLTWRTATETNNLCFEIERGTDGIAFYPIATVPGHGTTTFEQNYHHQDRVTRPGDYYYRLKQIDLSGEFSYSQQIKITISPPEGFALRQNYPNPFNQGTTIAFDLSTAEKARIIIHSIDGRSIRTLTEAWLQAGHHTLAWDGRDASGKDLPSGIYIVTLKAGEFSQTRKMSIVR